MDWIQGPHGKGWRGAALALVILGLLAQWPLRLDVTEDQRHSLSSATNDMLSELAGGEDDVLVKCYLEGDFPARYPPAWRRNQVKTENFCPQEQWSSQVAIHRCDRLRR